VIRRVCAVMLAATLIGAGARADAPAGDVASATAPSTTSASSPAPAPAVTSHGVRQNGLQPLVPAVAARPFEVDPGVRPYQYRLSVSPAYGFLGSGTLFSFRLAYNPNDWLGYEAALGHNPGQSVHAVLHTFSAIVRRPRAGRLQPYLSLGYGMIIVFPGQSLNAAPVTKNAVAYGGGCEWFIRNDLALRGDLREATVFGSQRAQPGVVLYDYVQGTIGLAFYRSIRP